MFNTENCKLLNFLEVWNSIQNFISHCSTFPELVIIQVCRHNHNLKFLLKDFNLLLKMYILLFHIIPLLALKLPIEE